MDWSATFCVTDNENFLNEMQIVDGVEDSLRASFVRYDKLGLHVSSPALDILWIDINK